ncbi:MAG: flavodoxin [Caldilineaceae bacterium]|nr:flavodoxin [Caldilineaceae bacterium]
MRTLGIFFGSTNGDTARIAENLAERLTPYGDVDLCDVADFYLDALADYDDLILGIPTWNSGQLQEDWEAALEDVADLDLAGKKVALFGLGDQVGYPATFVDALFFVAEFVRARHGQLVGRWPTQGYTFDQSWAVEDEMFLGLVLDEVNQPELTSARVARWIELLRIEFGWG